MYNARWRSQVFISWCKEIQTNFLFTELAVFLMYREINVHIFAITKQSIHWRLYCVKNEAILSQIPRGSGCVLTKVGCLCVMCSAISVGPCGMVQPIAAAVLKTFTMTNKDGGIHPCTMLAANSEGIWNNYVDIQDINMQVRFIIFLSTWGYSLGDPTRQHKVWRKILLKYKLSWSIQCKACYSFWQICCWVLISLMLN